MHLSTRYFVAFAALATTAFVVFGGIEAYTDYRRDVAYIGELQRGETRLVATRIAAYLDTVSMQLAEVNALPWSSDVLGAHDRREELQRLLKRNPAIHELRFVDLDGRERNLVSRLALDRRDSGAAWPLHEQYVREGSREAWYGPVYFLEGSTPYVSLAVRDKTADRPELLVAEINLRYVTDLIASGNVVPRGRAFVVDSTNHLIAHPNLSLVHRKLDVGSLPQVVNARSRMTEADPGRSTQVARSIDNGAEVLTSAAAIDSPGWLVFVEQPLAQVMAPVWTGLWRTALLIVLLLAVAIAVSRWLAHALTRPILALERGTARIAAGDLGVRVDVDTGDELQALATQFNRMTESLARSYAELEGKVDSRTRDLADANRKVQAQADQVAALNEELQLRLAELAAKKEEAERANAAKTRFLAAASHDLRQPMQAISLLMEVLRERISAPELRKLADKVQGSVQALESLFVSLLDISRLDAGAIRPHVQEFSIDSLLSLIEVNFLPQALAKGLKLQVVHSSAVVTSDPALLERILSNLVSNALRYTPTGRILVGARRRGDRLRILVIDTGIGVPPHLHGDIFEEFFQVANPERDRSKGLGLGLSIVKRTAQILGHPLSVGSLPNRGSVFAIEVPLVRRPGMGAADVSFVSPDRTRLEGMFVLVIDDDRENRFAIEALCTQWGCHVQGAASVQNALARLEEHLRSPDLVITDYRLRLPDTGTEAIARVRAMLEEDVPAIVITGDMSVRESDVAAAGRMALLYKPINAAELWNAAEKLLAANAQGERAPPLSG